MKTEEYKDNASSRSSLMRGSEAVARSMQRAALDGVELEYEVRGSGEPVLD